VNVIFHTLRPFDVISGLHTSVTERHHSTTNSVGLTCEHD